MRGVTISMDSSKIKTEYLNGAYSELANLLGIEAVLKIHSEYRGQQIFLPVDLFSKEFIWNQIVEEYNGHNIRQLATKYGYTEKWIRKILKDHIDNTYCKPSPTAFTNVLYLLRKSGDRNVTAFALTMILTM